MAARLAKAGHDVVVSFSRDEQNLEDLAAKVGAVAAGPADAAQAEVVVLSVPWVAWLVLWRS